MARAPVDTRMGVELLQPRARPVDTFVQAPRSPLLDFAEQLAKIDRPLRQFMDDRAEKTAKEDELRGQQEWYAGNREGLNEATSKGLLPAQDNPHFVTGYKKAQGNATGERMTRDFLGAFEAWDGKNSEDPAAYDEFLESFIKEQIGGVEDPDILRSLMPHVQQIEQLGTKLYTQYRSEATVRGSLDAHMSVALGAIDKGNEQGLSVPEGTNYEAVFEAIQLQRQDFIESGGNPDLWDKGMVDGMSIKVLTSRDPGLLKWFDQKVPGKDYTYGDTPYGAKVKAETTSSLEVIGRQAIAAEKAAQEDEDKKLKDAVQRQTLEFLAANPSAPIPEGLMEQGTRTDPLFRSKLGEWRNNLSKGFSDPEAVKAVYSAVAEGQGTKAVLDAMAQGVFGDPEEFTKAYNFAKSFEDNKDRIGTALSTGQAQSILKDLDIRTKGINEFDMSPLDGMSNEGYEAQYDFRRAVSEWVARNPDATPQEVDEAVAKIGKVLLSSIVKADPTDPTVPGEYKRSPNAPFDNPYTEGTTPPPAPEAPEETPPVDPAAQPTEAPTPEDQEDAKTFLEGLTPEQQAAMEERAAAMGIDLDTFVGTYVLGDNQGPDLTEGTAPPPSPEEQNRGIIDRLQQQMTPQDALSGDDEVFGARPIAYSPGEQAGADLSAIQQAPARGLAALVTSNKRGYSPDIENLRPEVKTGVVALQQAWGKALPVVSGFRNKKRNKKAGGAGKSQHIHGNAVDIDVSDMSRADQLKLIALASSQGFKGIGVYGGSIHLDYGGRRAWGPSYGKESIPSWARGAIAAHMANTSAPNIVATQASFTPDEAVGLIDEALLGDATDYGYPGSAQIEGDEVASRLANVIYSREAGGNYNAVAGNANSKRDLSKMTLNQILATQVVARRRGVKSTAVGAGQFVYKTLKGLKEELGLSGNEPFTPALQDRLFMTLLNRRGYQLFKAGKISKRQFAFRLSQEWAALENPYTGKSYYDGVGNNKARAKASEVYAALGI